jgi:protein-L-isoaspartate(D-aspartate) O-methyltransferase
MADDDENAFGVARRNLVSEIECEAADTAHWTGRPRYAGAVIDALIKVPRHRFVAPSQHRFAYDNRPLEIGHGQTISQPYIVALMSDLLDIGPHARVLEIGTGCGYQAAILAELAEHVYSIERLPELATRASECLAALGYRNVSVRCGDGFVGWPEAAPFDGIIVTAAPPAIPPALVDQLAIGGRLVIPVGLPGTTQTLKRCVKTAEKQLKCEEKLPVAFVPMLPDD